MFQEPHVNAISMKDVIATFRPTNFVTLVEFVETNDALVVDQKTFVAMIDIICLGRLGLSIFSLQHF